MKTGPVSCRIAKKKLRQAIEKPKVEPQIEDKVPEAASSKGPSQKVLITGIEVTGVTVFPQETIKKITSEYLNKELALDQMQKVADLVTDLYRKRGFITSRAYLPPQKIENGSMQIKVIEAVVGDIQIHGNRFYKTSLLKKYITLDKGKIFNYSTLKEDLVSINEHPDRYCRAVLAPGKDPGSTDVILEVKDNLPIHVGAGYDNFASRFIGRNRYITTVTDNNLLGRDDVFSAQYQLADAENLIFLSWRYLYPITKNLDIGFFAARSKLALGKEYKDVMARGKSKLFSLYGSQALIKKDNLTFNLNFGFDYKDLFNFLLGQVTSRDRLRIAKLGFDFDATDNFGRTILTNEVGYGIPGIMGGTPQQPTADKPTSRSGSGGKFVKDTLNLFRLQRLPFDATFLWKNQCQFSPYILTAAEEFQIGGPANNRGYPPAEYVGDQGYSMNFELLLPVYFIPKNIRFPFLNSKIYDAFRIVTFYDWTNARLRRPLAGERKDRTIRSAGCGIRFNLPQNFSARFEMGWPLDVIPSDGKHIHKWIEISKSF